jgi:DNA-directed RNA polymerase specialized sigma24 family protein
VRGELGDDCAGFMTVNVAEELWPYSVFVFRRTVVTAAELNRAQRVCHPKRACPQVRGKACSSTMPKETAIGAQFPPTRWSLIAQAGGGVDLRTRQAALEEICRAYWRPLYAFARRKGCPPSDAEDLTQSFFMHLLEGPALATADSRLGTLRTFLLTRFQSFMVDSWRREHTQKRGGDALHLSLDFHDAEEWCALELQSVTTPDAVFARQWVNALLESVLARLREDYVSNGRGTQFDALRSFLNFDDATAGDYSTAATTLGTSPTATRQAVHRLRERFSRTLRDQIAETLPAPTPEAIDEELAALRHIIASQAA